MTLMYVNVMGLYGVPGCCDVITYFKYTAQSALVDQQAGGGGRARRMPPYGTKFFHFHIHFWQKVPMSEVHTPLTGPHPPTGNPGSATDQVSLSWTKSLVVSANGLFIQNNLSIVF